MSRRRGRFGASIVEQGLYAASNLLLSAGIAITADIEVLGAFAVTYAVVVVGVGIVKAATAEVLLASVVSGSPLNTRREYRFAMAASLPVAALVVVVGVAVGLGWWAALLLGVASPLVAIFEVTRARCVIEGDLARSSLADLVWMVPVIVGMIVRGPLGSVEALIGLWVGGCVAALVITLMSEFGNDRSIAEPPVLRRQDRQAFAVEFITSQVLGHMVIWLVGITIGLAASGQIRLAELATSPLTQFLIALRWTGLASTRAARGAARPLVARRLSLAGGAAAGLVLAAALLVPLDWLGTIRSVDDPPLLRLLIALMALHRLGVAMSIGPSLLLRVGGMARRSARNRALSAGGSLICIVPGLVAARTDWVVLGLAAASIVAGLGWWWDLRRVRWVPAGSDVSNDEIREMTPT